MNTKMKNILLCIFAIIAGTSFNKNSHTVVFIIEINHIFSRRKAISDVNKNGLKQDVNEEMTKRQK